MISRFSDTVGEKRSPGDIFRISLCGRLDKVKQLQDCWIWRDMSEDFTPEAAW